MQKEYQTSNENAYMTVSLSDLRPKQPYFSRIHNHLHSEIMLKWQCCRNKSFLLIFLFLCYVLWFNRYIIVFLKVYACIGFLLAICNLLLVWYCEKIFSWTTRVASRQSDYVTLSHLFWFLLLIFVWFYGFFRVSVWF